MLYLKALNAQDAQKEHAFFQLLPCENGFSHPYEGIDFHTFVTECIPHRLSSSRGEDLLPDHVPDT